MSPQDAKITHLKSLAGLASELCDFIHHGDYFAKHMAIAMPILKEAMVIADCMPGSGNFSSELCELAEMERNPVKADDVKLLQGLLGLELVEKDYESIFEKFPKNARKKTSVALDFIGRELQIFVSDELAHS